MSTKAKKEIDPPKPGANAFHYFNYSQKIALGEKYDYQKTLKKWRSLSDSAKRPYEDSAYEAPRHQKAKGAQRNVSAYDVLRRELRYLNENGTDLSSVNQNTLASQIRKYLSNSTKQWGDNGEKWLTTPSEDHYSVIKRVIRTQKLLK